MIDTKTLRKTVSKMRRHHVRFSEQSIIHMIINFKSRNGPKSFYSKYKGIMINVGLSSALRRKFSVEPTPNAPLMKRRYYGTLRTGEDPYDDLLF